MSLPPFISAEVAKGLRPPKRSLVESTKFIQDGMAYRGVSESDMLALHLNFNQFVTTLSNRTDRPMIFGPRLSLSHPNSAFGDASRSPWPTIAHTKLAPPRPVWRTSSRRGTPPKVFVRTTKHQPQI